MMWRLEDLRDIPCDLCHGSDLGLIFTRPDGLRVVECKSCQLQFISPRPLDSLVHRIYESGYYSKNGSSSSELNGVGYVDYLSSASREDVAFFARQRFQLVNRILTIPEGALCLEIGCASGEFATLATSHGLSVLGIDISSEAVANARERHSSGKFEVKSVEDVQGKELYDAIFAFEVIEHVLSPLAFLENIRRLLKVGGVACFSTPNVDCASAVGRENWAGYLSSFEHMYFFGIETLKRYATRCGLEVTSQLYTGGSGLLSGPSSASKLAVRNLLQSLGILPTAKRIRYLLMPPKLDANEDCRRHGLNVAMKRVG